MNEDIWINDCFDTAVEALLFLSKNDRPAGGQEKFNAEHLYQICRELIISEAGRLGNSVEGKINES